MPNFSTIEDTLFVPMLGRIYASENFPHVLYDPKALELKDQLPQNLKGQNSQTQYTLMASAVRSKNMDRYICDFFEAKPGWHNCRAGLRSGNCLLAKRSGRRSVV